MKVKKNDQVLIISGEDREKKSKILQCLPKKGKIIVEGVNLKKKHIKPKKQGEKGQVILIPRPMDVSNVKFICPKCKKATKIGYKKVENKKHRICKKCNQVV